MTLSNQSYQSSIKSLEEAVIKIQTSHDVIKKTLGIISNFDKISQNFLDSQFYFMTIEFDLNKKNIKQKNKIITSDLDSFQFHQLLDNEKFDIIYIGNILHYVKDPNKILNQLSLYLNETGSIIGYSHNISHISTRIHLLDGDFNCEKIGLDENALHFHSLDSLMIILNYANYSLINLYKIKDKIDLKRTNLFHYKFPSDLLESILTDPESDTLYYVFQAVPNAGVDKFTRKWVNQFSRNTVTEKLNSIIESYRKIIAEKASIIDYYQQVIKDRHLDIQKQDINVDPDKYHESHLSQIIEQKDILMKGLMESIEIQKQAIENLENTVKQNIVTAEISSKEKENIILELQKMLCSRTDELDRIHNSFTWKMLRRLDKIRQI